MRSDDETEVISRLPMLEDLEDLPEGVLAAIINDIVKSPAADDPQAAFQSGL